ncbi:MAG: tetratricopeptide repeat protein [Caulobacterales bacterium]|uniref:tetratricopeptide repeat protein n=1 Tax=Glycocaulis sp. TaxID=1969725 RepID=UPI003F9F1735
MATLAAPQRGVILCAMIAHLASLMIALAAVPPGVTLTPETADEPRESLTLEERLDERLAALAEASSEIEGETIADEVRSIWRQSAGATASLLLERAERALAERDMETAKSAYAYLRLLEPDFAEGWLVSAQLAIGEGDWDFALDALTRAVNLEPRRFDAYALLGRTLEQASEPAAALAAYEEALRVHPWHPQARQARARLENQMSGRAL